MLRSQAQSKNSKTDFSELKQGWIKDQGGNKRHYVDDVIHNDNGPAEIHANGTKEWLQHGKLHRLDGPASEDAVDDVDSWWYHGEYFGSSERDYNQELFEKDVANIKLKNPNVDYSKPLQGWIEDLDGSKYHYVDNKLHNDNGPAVISANGDKFWHKNQKKHRENGPAIEYANGKNAWWYEDEYLGGSWNGFTQKKFEQWLKDKNMNKSAAQKKLLHSQAQELFIVNPKEGLMPLPLEVHDEHDHNHDQMHESIEVNDDPIELQIIMDLPGAPPGTKDPEPVLEVEEEEKSKEDENEASAKDDKWNWSKDGPSGFIAWVKSRCDNVPKHSGLDTAGIERASAYLTRLDNEISKAMRLDIDGELDANQIEKVRAIIDNGIEKLNDRLDKIKKSKKKKKKASFEPLIKEGQKITGVQGIYVTVPLLISRIARLCINGQVSAGHNIDDTFREQVKKFKLSEREQAETLQLLSDMGYAVREDRGYLNDEEVDLTSSDNFDWAANYQG